MSQDTAVIAGSAPVTATEPVTPAENQTVPAAETTNQTPANTAVLGAEPVLGDKGVEELKTQRRKRREAENQAAYWRGVAESGKKTQETEIVKPVTSPKLEDFENYDDFLVARAKHEIRQEQEKENQVRESERKRNFYTERFRKAVEKHPDLQEIAMSLALNPAIPQNPAMRDAIMDSELGPEITQYLGQNHNEAIRIASLSPIAAMREIGKIEVKLQAPAPTVQQIISQAPEPIRAVSPKGAVLEFDYEKADMNSFMDRRNKEAPPGRR